MKNSHILHLKLSHKGLILVGFPLLFELLFVITLASLLRQAESDAAKARHSKALIGQANTLMQDIYQGGAVISGYMMTGGGPVFQRRYKDLMDTIPKEVAELERSAQTESDDREHLRKAVIVTRQMLDLFASMKGYADEFSNNVVSFEANPEFVKGRLERLRQSFEPMIAQLTSELNTSIERHKRIEAASEKAGVNARNLVVTCLQVGVGLNFVLALALAVYFNKGTSSRLAVVTDNTIRLAKGEPLNETLSGNDEIALVDRTFHEMASALAEAAQRERAVVEYAVDVICSIDESGKFRRISPASLKLWQYAPTELIGTSLSDLLVADDVVKTQNTIEEIKRGAKSGAFENRVRRKDGTEIEMLWSVYWSDKEQSLFCVAHDDSARKELERRKQDFFRMISHDLRSPLTSLQAFLEGISRGSFDNKQEKLKLRAVQAESAAVKMIDLVSAILDIEKMEAGEMKLLLQPASLDSIVESAVETLRDLAEKQGIVIEAPNTNLSVNADEGYIRQVIINLISNAIKFSPPGSKVTVASDRQNGFVEVKVIDQGRGIPPDSLERVFEKFKQVSRIDGRDKRGTGLGLPICKAIIEAHGGSIGVVSDGKSGSTFWFKLPYSGT